MFTLKKHLYAHTRKFHNKNLFVIKKKAELNCNVCKKSFSLKSSLYKHQINVHKRQTDHDYSKNVQNISRLLCPVEPCVIRFLNYASLRHHLQSHSIEVQKEEHEFTSIEGKILLY